MSSPPPTYASSLQSSGNHDQSDESPSSPGAAEIPPPYEPTEYRRFASVADLRRLAADPSISKLQPNTLKLRWVLGPEGRLYSDANDIATPAETARGVYCWSALPGLFMTGSTTPQTRQRHGEEPSASTGLRDRVRSGVDSVHAAWRRGRGVLSVTPYRLGLDFIELVPSAAERVGTLQLDPESSTERLGHGRTLHNAESCQALVQEQASKIANEIIRDSGHLVTVSSDGVSAASTPFRLTCVRFTRPLALTCPSGTVALVDALGIEYDPYDWR